STALHDSLVLLDDLAVAYPQHWALRIVRLQLRLDDRESRLNLHLGMLRVQTSNSEHQPFLIPDPKFSLILSRCNQLSQPLFKLLGICGSDVAISQSVVVDTQHILIITK